MKTCLAGLLILAGPYFAGPYLSAQTLHIGNAGEPETLDPHRYNLRLEETILTDLFMGLTTFNATGETVPGSAASWDVSDDGLTWTFQLREGLQWSDGRPLTAYDFVFAFRRLLDPDTAASLAYFMYMLENAEAVNAGRLPTSALGVQATNARELVLKLGKPYPYLPERLLYPTGHPVPRHVIEKVGDNWIKPEHWVSNGAYALADWQPQSHVRLIRNELFHAPAAIETVVYHPLANEQSAYNRFRTGEVHAVGNFPAGELDWIKANMGDRLRLSPLLSIVYLVFNTTTAPFSDVGVRQALAMMIDRRVLTDQVQRSGNQPNPSFVPEIVDQYQPVALPNGTMSQAERIAKALQLLAAAGFDEANPLNLTLRYVSGTEAKRSSLAIAAFWKRIGVETQLHQSELKVHFADLRQNDFQVAQAGWFGENNAEHYLGLLVSDTGNVNYGRYHNAAYDDLMARARREADLATRNAILREAERLVLPEYPVIPLYRVMIRRLVDPRLQGWHENPRDVHPARFLNWR
ncbi:MAG: peptide ABC transporter substrate-binding protein [Gammaproteobacteria bacterium]|nr:peptide ABC transporter substrate-binding protein [Gammaproteobacteria bacterium]